MNPSMAGGANTRLRSRVSGPTTATLLVSSAGSRRSVTWLPSLPARPAAKIAELSSARRRLPARDLSDVLQHRRDSTRQARQPLLDPAGDVQGLSADTSTRVLLGPGLAGGRRQRHVSARRRPGWQARDLT